MRNTFLVVLLVIIFGCNNSGIENISKLDSLNTEDSSDQNIEDSNKLIGEWGIYATSSFMNDVTVSSTLCNECPRVVFHKDHSVTSINHLLFITWDIIGNTLCFTKVTKEINNSLFNDSCYEMKYKSGDKSIELELFQKEKNCSYTLRRPQY